MNFATASFPVSRPRRLRDRRTIRNLVRETQLSTADLIWPIFVHSGTGAQPINSMPDVNRLSVDLAVEAASKAQELGIQSIAIFPCVPEELKSPKCEEAWNPENLANKSARAIRSNGIPIEIMLDVALDPYNSDGHDGLYQNGEILNDETLECLNKQALAHAEAGASILGPSDMMDGRIGHIRNVLEANGYHKMIILSYSAKYASSLYTPFRDSIGSSSKLMGNKVTYQLDPANSDEALRMVQRDLSEGADAVIIKPGMLYLDICQRVRQHFKVPIFAYQVSGEYAMFKAAAAAGIIDIDQAMFESLLAFKRADCTGILSYFAYQAAKSLNQMEIN